jgi:hypothetical protein
MQARGTAAIPCAATALLVGHLHVLPFIYNSLLIAKRMLAIMLGQHA